MGLFLKGFIHTTQSTVYKAIADGINFFMLCYCLVIELKRFHLVNANNLPISFAKSNYADKLHFPAI